MIRVRTHEVAQAAFRRVEGRRDASFKKPYGALAHKLPGLILQNGLAQATGLLLAKHRDEHLALLEDLHAVLHAAGQTNTEDGKALHQAIIAADLVETMRLTRAGLVAAGWLKRYVQGVLRLGATGESQDPPAEAAEAGGRNGD